jgi:hypothetical protein
MQPRIAQWLLEPGAEHSSHTLFGQVKMLGILPPLMVLSLMTPNWYKTEPSPPSPNPMYDEYGEFRGHVLINQHKWQVHYFDALDTKPGSDIHDALEQFVDDPDSVINLIVYRANCVRYICDHETVEAAPKFVMTLEPDYGQLHPHLGWLPIDAIKKTFEHTTQLARMPMSTILKK